MCKLFNKNEPKEWTKYGVKMSMTWNSENRMTESISQNIYSGAKTLTRYKYDHEGNRVVKSSNYGEVVTPSAEISYRNDSIVTKHIFVSGVRVASKVCDDKSSNTYYQSVDHLGSTNILTDSKGEFYEHIETFPDGSIWVKEYVDQSGVNAVFTCHEMDVETKFFYAKARYYDAQLGRFISVDPIIGSYLPTGDRKRDGNMPGYGGFYNPVNINMYSYGANNPLKFVDPTGMHNEHRVAFTNIFRIGTGNIIDGQYMVTVKDGYVVKSNSPGVSLGYNSVESGSPIASLLVRGKNGRLYLMRIYRTSTGANDRSRPRRIADYTIQAVDNDMKVVGKESKLVRKNFVNKKGIPVPREGDKGKMDEYQIVGGYSPAEEGDETGKHPDLVQTWEWKNKYNVPEAAVDGKPYARDGYPQGDKNNYHTVNGENRYDGK